MKYGVKIKWGVWIRWIMALEDDMMMFNYIWNMKYEVCKRCIYVGCMMMIICMIYVWQLFDKCWTDEWINVKYTMDYDMWRKKMNCWCVIEWYELYKCTNITHRINMILYKNEIVQ